MKKFLVALFVISSLIGEGVLAQEEVPAIKYSAESIDAYNCAVNYHNENKFELAENAYKKALKLEPTFIEATNNLEILYQSTALDKFEKKDYNESIKSAQKALDINPTNFNTYNIIINCYQKLNDDENLIETYNKALTLDSEDINTLKGLANSYVRTQKYDEAINIYTKLISLEPENSDSKEILASLYHNIAHKNYTQGQYEEAIKFATLSLELKDKNTNIYYILAQIYTKNNNLPKAKEIYEKITQLEPQNQIANENLDYMKFQLKNAQLNTIIDNLKITEAAPEKFNELIILDEIDSSYRERVKHIIDIYWNTPEGQIILTTLGKKGTLIKISNEEKYTDISYVKLDRTLFFNNFIGNFNSNSTNTPVIKFPIQYVDNYYNNKLYATQRMNYLQAFMQEFVHVYISIKKSKNENSKQEVIATKVFCHNLVHKIITGKELTEEQTIQYFNETMTNLENSPLKELPNNYEFANTATRLGIKLNSINLYQAPPTPIEKVEPQSEKPVHLEKTSKEIKNKLKN